MTKLTSNFNLDAARSYANSRLAEYSPKSMDDLYNDDRYEAAALLGIIVEEPELFLDGEVSDEVLEELTRVYEEAGGCASITEMYAYEDVNDIICEIARELSEKYNHLIFAVYQEYCEHGNREWECSEDLDWYMNGKDMFDAVDEDYADED